MNIIYNPYKKYYKLVLLTLIFITTQILVLFYIYHKYFWSNYYNFYFSLCSLALLLLCLFFINTLLSNILRAQKFVVSENSIVFPDIFSKKMHNILTRDKSEISKVIIGSLVSNTNTNYDIEFSKFNKNKLVILYFKNGGKATVNLDYISKDEIYKFISLFKDFYTLKSLDTMERRKSINIEQNSTQPVPIEFKSYTHMWQSEYEQYYASTNYIPLKVNIIINQKYKIINPINIRPHYSNYFAHDINSDINVIIKEFYINDLNNNEFSSNLLLKEFEVLKSINHKYISKIIDIFTLNSRHYLVLQYINGKNLYNYRNSLQKLHLKQTFNIMIQISDIIEYLHSHTPPIIHRDITPDNIIIDNNHKCFLIDFGAARFLINGLTHTIIGKHGYMPLEQIKGKPSMASDVYCLGATMYYLLTNSDPIPLAMQSPKKIQPDIPDKVNKFVEDATRIDEKDRIQNIVDFKSRLNQIVIDLYS